MFKKGDRVKINPKSKYFNRGENQLPYGVIGTIREDQEIPDGWILVRWGGGHNAYHKEDLIKVATFKGNK